jgi:hypothetical protein
MADGDSSSGSGSSSTATAGTSDGYDQFNWKEIVKAVTGSDPDDPSSDAIAYLISDPNSIQAAADAFYATEQVLHQAATNLGQQVDALTGPNGPWQGGAAQALNSVMTTLATQTKNVADTLSGGITGDYNIPQQLANNAQNLRDATNKIWEIDDFYANAALAYPDTQMPNGHVAISKAPAKLAEHMTADMRQVLMELSGFYQVTTGHVAQPTPPTTPGGTNPGGSIPYSPTSQIPIGPSEYLGPGYTNPDFTDFNSPNLDPYTSDPGLNNDPTSPLGPMGTDNGPLSPYSGDLNLGNGPASPNDLTNNSPFNSPLSPYSGDTSLSDGPSSLMDPTGLTNSPLSPYSGDTSLADGPSSLLGPTGLTNSPLSPFSDLTNSPLSPFSDTSLGSGSSLDNPASFPGMKLASNPKNLSDTSKSPSALNYPDSLSLDNPGATDSLGGPSGLDLPGLSGLDSPGLNTSGVSGPNLGDTQGLSDYPNAELGSGSGGLSADSTGGSGSGMPMMPMSGMGGGGAGAGGSGGPSDASGLLEGDSAPWQGSPLLDASGDVSGRGAAPGGVGLNLPDGGGLNLSDGGGLNLSDGGGLSAPGADQAASGSPMMPMMPMSGMGGGAGSNDREGGASDASGLLDGSSEPWSVTSAGNGTDVGSAQGAPQGAGLLRLPDETGDVASSGPAEGEDLFGPPAAASSAGPSAESSAGPSTEEAAATGLLAGLPFLAAGAWSTAGGSGRGDSRRAERAEAWGEPTREGAEGTGPVAASAGSSPQEQEAHPAPVTEESGIVHEAPVHTATAPERLVAQAPEMREAAPETVSEPAAVQESAAASTAGQTVEAAPQALGYPAYGSVQAPSGAPASAPPSAVGSDGRPVPATAEAQGAGPARQSAQAARSAEQSVRSPRPEARTTAARAADPVAPAAAAVGPAADDTTAWDATDTSILRLFGHPTAAGTGHGADASMVGEESAAVTGVAGAAYMIGRTSASGEAEAFDEPVRPAWRPKPAGPGRAVRRELTCSTDEGPAKPEPPAAETGPERRKNGKDDDEDKSSVADLLRQSDEIWGAGTPGSGAIG